MGCIFQFKLLTLMHGAMHTNSPCYLADRLLVMLHTAVRVRLTRLFVVPWINRRALSCTGPSLWNSLPLHSLCHNVFFCVDI